MAEFELLLFGACGFCGRLVTAALSGYRGAFLGPLPDDFRGCRDLAYALVGRSETKLRQVHAECGCPESVPVLTLDATDAKAVAAAVRRAKVVLNVLHRECDRSVRAVLCGWCGIVSMPFDLCALLGASSLGGTLRSATAYVACYDGLVDPLPSEASSGEFSRSYYMSLNQSFVLQSAKLLGWVDDFVYEELAPAGAGLVSMSRMGTHWKLPSVAKVARWHMVMECIAPDGRVSTATASGGEGAWEDTSRFLLEAGLALLHEPDACPGLASGGVLSCAAAMGLPLAARCTRAGLPIEVEAGGCAEDLIRATAAEYRARPHSTS